MMQTMLLLALFAPLVFQNTAGVPATKPKPSEDPSQRIISEVLGSVPGAPARGLVLFRTTSNDNAKAYIAAALIARDVPCPDCEKYLRDEADKILHPPGPPRYIAPYSDAPTINPAFEEWCKKNDCDLDQENEIFQWYSGWLFYCIASAQYPPFEGLLLDAMNSENYQVQAAAGMGLAGLHSSKGEEAVIRSCEQHPKYCNEDALLMFHDPVADAAAARLIEPKRLAILRNALPELERTSRWRDSQPHAPAKQGEPGLSPSTGNTRPK